MRLHIGEAVKHADFGPGRVAEVLGGQVVVEFFGERLTVEASSLEREEAAPIAVETDRPRNRVLFRQTFEAINLGVVPPHPDQLLALTIGGDRQIADVELWLKHAVRDGICKVVFGDYGSGKSHRLRIVEAAALRRGWVVSFVEFDPKQADPAKPHLIYRAITSSMRFPRRDDGSRSRNFVDFIGEVRNHWHLTSIGQHLRESPWWGPAMSVLRFQPHDDSRQYLDAVAWLGGQISQHAAIKTLAKEAGRMVVPPRAMPRTLECSDIYVHHLVVVNELCRALGYQGLLIILDEAEHVRSFSVSRQERANNLFDLLARCAHKPLKQYPDPYPNEHAISLPTYWKQGPHFGVVVALTEGETFADSGASLKDSCVFLHDASDMVRLNPPKRDDYQRWCRDFLAQFVGFYPVHARVIADDGIEVLAKALADEYQRQPADERTLRLWTKVTTLVPSMLLARTAAQDRDQLVADIRSAAREAAGEVLPWEQ